jgi:hypothetical protein
MSDGDDTVRVWLVSAHTPTTNRTSSFSPTPPRTATATSARSALTSFSDVCDTTAAVEAAPENLGVTVEDHREAYATEAQRMAAKHDPDDVI